MNKLVVASVAASVPTVAPSIAGECSADNVLLELGIEYARLFEIEDALTPEKNRLWHLSLRQRWEKLGINPDDDEACEAALNEGRFEEILAAGKTVDRENGYDRVFRKWKRAHKATARVGKKILAHRPQTVAGFMIVARVIETHDELPDDEPKEAIFRVIRDFASRHHAA